MPRILSDPGFESFSVCPQYSNGGTDFKCTTWQSARYSPDYYNSCCTTGHAGVPLNDLGYQPAFKGNGYIGVYMYNDLSPSSNDIEYVMAEIPRMEKDEEYVVTMRVSLANVSPYGVDGFGALFTTYGKPAPDIWSLNYDNYTPQANFSSYGAITDTVNWVTLTKNVIADSAYNTILIGNFKPKAAVTKQIAAGYNGPYGWDFAYYYIDEVTVEKKSGMSVAGTKAGVEARIYPNPMADEATIRFSNGNKDLYTLQVINAQGCVVKKIENITGNSVKINRENMPSGVYVFRLANEQGLVAQGWFTAN
jgi:hypothetical protein